MSWKHLSFTDVIRVMQAVADVAPDKASKVGFVLAKGTGARRRAKKAAAAQDDGLGAEFVNPGPTVDEAAVLEEVMVAIKGKLVERWGQEYVDDLAARVKRV